MNGGDRTLATYGYFDRDRPEDQPFELPPPHRDFYASLVPYHVVGDYLFVHAGLGERELQSGDLEWALRRSRAEDLLWNRATVEMPHRLGVTVVYGHTPRQDLSVRWAEPFSIGSSVEARTSAAANSPSTT